MHEVYYRAFQRIKNHLHAKASDSAAEQHFEQHLKEIIAKVFSGGAAQLSHLPPMIDLMNDLELKRGQPLLFDTRLQLSTTTISILQTLHSFLYNLRGLTAIHHNEGKVDSIYDSLQVDSVKDYFHAPDLLTNEAILYHYIQNDESNSSNREWLTEAFRNHLPQSHFLVHALTGEFFSRKTREQLEQELYTFQIDWLLGSPAGLLYRIREELIGLREGYDQTFWPELQHEPNEDPIPILTVECVIGAEHIRQLGHAA
jgi:hypothetical protein